jgi:predicted pyridoxine 5'-phosphate oxidase superfamily flavin-nucleotide-binding protein
MAMLTDEMQRLILEQRLGFIATVCPDGSPNLSPKGTTTVFDDEHLVFADIISPNTVANLRHNPAIEINVVDPFVRKGYRFKGTAAVHDAGEPYHRGLDVLRERGYNTDTVKHIVLITVERALPLLSPVYSTGANEDEVRAHWARHFTALLAAAEADVS